MASSRSGSELPSASSRMSGTPPSGATIIAHASRVMPVLERAARACAGERPGVTREVATGVVIELATGTQIVATLEALVEREWPRLSAAIVARVNQETTS